MAGGRPEGLPQLFLDRSLGRHGVANRLRAAGLRLSTLAEVYGVTADEDVADVDWLALAGDRGWPVLMKDQRTRPGHLVGKSSLPTSAIGPGCAP